MEENVASGGYGEKVRAYIDENRIDCNVLRIAIPDKFVTHGSVDKLRMALGIDAQSVADRIMKEVQR